jgi:hypothetical protein
MTLDGELCAQTPVQIRVEPSVLTVLVPHAVASASARQISEAPDTVDPEYPRG